MKTIRVEVTNSSARGQSLDFFVNTGNSTEAPIICPAGNNGYPNVKDFYGRPMTHQGKHGVHVTVNFDGPANGNVFALNIFQPTMPGDFLVIPLV